MPSIRRSVFEIDDRGALRARSARTKHFNYLLSLSTLRSLVRAPTSNISSNIAESAGKIFSARGRIYPALDCRLKRQFAIYIIGNKIDVTDDIYHISRMNRGNGNQSDRALALLKQRNLMRLSEFTREGITAATIRRLEKSGRMTRPARGLYQLPGAELNAHHALAEAAKLVPQGIICLTSALAYHELTDTIPSRIWLAIGIKDWRPRVSDPPLQIVRFGPKVLMSGIETHIIEGVSVRIYSPAKTIVDMFRYRQAAGTRYRKSPGVNLAIEGLRNGLRSRKASAAAIVRFAEEAGVWKVIEPYFDAMTANA